MASDPQQAAPSADAPEIAVDSAAPAPSLSSPLTHRLRTKSDFQKIQLEEIRNRDIVHAALMYEAQNDRAKAYKRMNAEIADYQSLRTKPYSDFFPASRLYGQGYDGYGNGRTDIRGSHLVYPHQKPRLGHKKAPRLRLKRKDVAQQAEQVEELVPIRLDIEWDRIKLRDTFTWNLSDRLVAPELFATQLVEDFGLAPPAAGPVLEQVQQQLREQLVDFYPQIYTGEEALDPELPYSAYKNEEMRILIKLNITIGPHTLEDKFEWEINNPLNSPEEFAQSLARELSLAGEFTTAIAHSIREQCQLFTRSLYIVGHPFDGRPLEDADLIAAFLPSPLSSAFRPHQQAREYTPFLYELTEADLERGEVILLREQRRQKRSVNRRGGPTLPDLKDRQRTVRTLVVSKTIPGAAERVEDSRLYKRIGGAGKKRPGAQGDLSESSDEEDSNPESPAMVNPLSGTARTRGMRGAATAAQQRMANIGRSETPEAATLHHHETRTSARRYGGREIPEENPDGTTYIVKLKVGRERLRKFARELKAGTRPTPSAQPDQVNRLVANANSTPRPGSMGPPSTPNTSSQTLQPSTTPLPPQGGQIGRIDAPPPPPPGQAAPHPPPPPAWLRQSLGALSEAYPNDKFEGMMRYSPVSTVTDMPCAAPPPGQPVPDTVKFMYLPRIRCSDCPGKLYTPGPETTVGNFEVHLKNRQHRERVEARKAGGVAPN